MGCRVWDEVKGPQDFSGFWRLAKTENFDAFLQDVGLPWVVRKAALKFAGNAIDVVSHSGSVMRVTSLNAKGSWTRVYDTEKEVVQRNAEGALCRTTAWWEGKVFRSRLEGSPLGVCESWRYMRGGIMVVKTLVRLASGGEASMFWYFETMEVLHRHMGGQGRHHLLRRIERDQRQVEKATRRDNQYLQRLLLDWERWASPADEFIVVASPTYSRSRLRPGHGGAHLGSPHVSQGNLSKSPSASSLGSPLGDMRPDGRVGRSDLGSRSRLGSESTSALDKASVTDLAKADKMVAAAAAAAAAAGAAPRAPPVAAAAAAPPVAAGAGGGEGAAGAAGGPELLREISLTIRNEEPAAAAAGAAGTAGAAGALSVSSGEEPRSAAATAASSEPSTAPAAAAAGGAARPARGHVRVASEGSLGGLPSGNGVAAAHHRRNLSGEGADSEARPSLRPTPRSTPTHTQLPTSSEQLLAFKAREYLDGRGIAMVVPVATPNDTSEPQLLCMSPEQAEATAAKLRELEEEMLLARQAYRRGVNCCGCLVLSWASSSLPDHLRTWEMSVS